MERVIVKIVLENYQHDPSGLVFKRQNGGWLDMDTLQHRMGEALEQVEAMMEYGEELTITFSVKAKTEE